MDRLPLLETTSSGGNAPAVRSWWRPWWLAYRLWLKADCVDLSAAFAYHTLQSFFPALLIVLSLVSRVLGRDRELVSRLLQLVSLVLPETAMPIFEATLRRFTNQGFGAGLLGLVLLLLTACNIYLTLQRGADRLWWNRPWGLSPLPWHRLVRRFVLLRLKAIAILTFLALVVLLDQFVSTIPLLSSSVWRRWLIETLPSPWGWFGGVSVGVDLSVSFVLGIGSTLLLLWLLPSRRIPWRPLLPAAFLVGVSITLLNLLLGRTLLLLGLRFQTYGVVGGVLVLSLWIWLVGVILYYGQCVSIVLALEPSGGRSAPATSRRRGLRRSGWSPDHPMRP
jgi:membrane protein